MKPITPLDRFPLNSPKDAELWTINLVDHNFPTTHQQLKELLMGAEITDGKDNFMVTGIQWAATALKDTVVILVQPIP